MTYKEWAAGEHANGNDQCVSLCLMEVAIPDQPPPRPESPLVHFLGMTWCGLFVIALIGFSIRNKIEYGRWSGVDPATMTEEEQIQHHIDSRW